MSSGQPVVRAWPIGPAGTPGGMRRAATLTLLVLALLVAGCGDDGAVAGDDSHGKPGEELTHTGPAEQAVAGEE